MNLNAPNSDCNRDGADLITTSEPILLPDRIHVRMTANSHTVISLTVANTREYALDWRVTTGARPPIANFLVTHNANGLLDPPEYGAFNFNNNGFPHPTTDDRPSDRQQRTFARWGIHASSANLFGPWDEAGTFLDRIRWKDNRQTIGADDYEIRFTPEGSQALRLFEDNTLEPVPFELWRIGNAATTDDSDDVRLVPVMAERQGDTNPGTFDIGGDHVVSGGDNDPFTDTFYWFEPIEQSPGEAGYQKFLTDQSKIGHEIFGRMVLVNWNGGLQPPWVEMPEEGTVFQILTRKRPFLGAETRTLLLDPFSEQAVDLSFQSYGLSPGRYTEDLVISTNDPEVPTKSIEVTVDIAFFEETRGVDSTAAADYIFVNGVDTVSTVAFAKFGTVSSLTLTEIATPVEPLLQPSLSRYFELDTNGGAGFDASVRFWYRDEDIPDGANESALALFRLTESGWIMFGGTVDPLQNTIEVTGLTEFGRFAIADPNAVGIEDDALSFPNDSVLLSPIYPNPANEQIQIRFELDASIAVRIELYDALGRRVDVVSTAVFQPGEHDILHSVATLPTGVYFVRMQAGDSASSRPIVLVR
jgi:hypothetical protein